VLDLVAVPGRVLHVGTDLETTKAAWTQHRDLQLPWHYFAKETGSLDVEIGDLLVQRCPTTWAELGEVVPDLVERLRPAGAGGDHPADDLSWEEAVEAARRLADHHGLPLRLLTEFEWEHLARGTGDRAYPWGEEFDPTCCNLAEAGVGRTEPVGSRPAGASEHGLLDLAGNVDEWTSSTYAPLPGAHWTVPEVETWSADPHVTRGGSYLHHRDLARSRRRHALYRPWTGGGLRLAADAPRTA